MALEDLAAVFPDWKACCGDKDLDVVHKALSDTVLEFQANPFCAPLTGRIMAYAAAIDKIKASLFSAEVPFAKIVTERKDDIVQRLVEAYNMCISLEKRLRTYLACCQYAELALVTFREKDKDGNFVHNADDKSRIMKNFKGVMSSKQNAGKIELPEVITNSVESFLQNGA